MSLRHLGLAVLLAWPVGGAWAASWVVRFEGRAYEMGGSRYLFAEEHEERIEGDRWLGGSTTYVAPDGSILARKRFEFSTEPFVPEYRLDLLQEGSFEGVRLPGGSIEMYRQDRRMRRPQTAQAERSPLAVSNAGLHAFIRAHFGALVAGAELPFELLDPASMASYAFRIHRVGRAAARGGRTVQFEAAPSSLLRFFTTPLRFTYDPQSQRLLRYDGPSDIHEPVSGKTYEVSVFYDGAAGETAPAQGVQGAQKESP